MTLQMISDSGWLVVLLWCWKNSNAKSQSQNRMHHTPYVYGKYFRFCGEKPLSLFLLSFSFYCKLRHTKIYTFYATYTRDIKWMRISHWMSRCKRSAPFLPYFPQVHCISCLRTSSNPYVSPHILWTYNSYSAIYKSLCGICLATDSPLSVRQFKRYDDIVTFAVSDKILKANESIQQLLLNSFWTQLVSFCWCCCTWCGSVAKGRLVHQVFLRKG